MNIKVSLALPVTFFSLMLLSSSVPAIDHLVLSIHPYKSPTQLLRAYKPLADYLSSKMGMPIKVSISKDYQSHIDAIGLDRVDIAYMGPASYVNLVNRYGKKPILACQEVQGKPVFQGKIIARKDSQINTLGQLEGKRFAFGDPNSTMSHLVPRYMLWKAGVDASKLKSYKFLGSHDNVALSVLTGVFDAGAVKEAVFNKYQKRGLKVIESTPALSEHVFVTSGKLDTTLVERLRDAFLTLDKDPRGEKIMNSIKPGITAMRFVEDKNYDNLREILKTLKDLGVIQ